MMFDFQTAEYSVIGCILMGQEVCPSIGSVFFLLSSKSSAPYWQFLQSFSFRLHFLPKDDTISPPNKKK